MCAPPYGWTRCLSTIASTVSARLATCTSYVGCRQRWHPSLRPGSLYVGGVTSVSTVPCGPVPREMTAGGRIRPCGQLQPAVSPDTDCLATERLGDCLANCRSLTTAKQAGRRSEFDTNNPCGLMLSVSDRGPLQQAAGSVHGSTTRSEGGWRER